MSSHDHPVVEVELRTMQALIEDLLRRLEIEDRYRWLHNNHQFLQFDARTLHAYGLQKNAWAEGRIAFRFNGELWYFDSHTIFQLLCFVTVNGRALDTSAVRLRSRFGNH